MSIPVSLSERNFAKAGLPAEALAKAGLPLPALPTFTIVSVDKPFRQAGAEAFPLHEKPAQMIGSTISHYKILDKLGEVPKWPTSVPQRVVAILRIPPLSGGSCRRLP